MFVLEDGVSFPEQHDLTTVGALMLQYGWKCVLFGCYDFFGSPPNRYTVKLAFCTVDEDECSTGSHYCSKGAVCINTIGSYRCACPAGYEGDGFNCTDVNECQQGENHCSEYGRCENIPGGYKCQCSDAYEGDGYNCSDVDECSRSPDICGPNSTCDNMVGGYVCSCGEGYSYLHNQCIDVNECEGDSHGCSENGVCMNVLGGYTCSCEAGYVGDGFNCTGSVHKVNLVVVLFSVGFVGLAVLLITALIYRICGSRRRQWWLYAYKMEWETEDVNEDFQPVDPEPSIFSGSLSSIIEPLQKQYDLATENGRRISDKELDSDTRSCSSVEEKNETGCISEEDGRAQSSVSLPDFQFEDPQKIETMTGDGGFDILFPKDESGFASDTSSFQYLSFYKLRHQK
jgi:hypothetical protein